MQKAKEDDSMRKLLFFSTYFVTSLKDHNTTSVGCIAIVIIVKCSSERDIIIGILYHTQWIMCNDAYRVNGNDKHLYLVTDVLSAIVELE